MAAASRKASASGAAVLTSAAVVVALALLAQAAPAAALVPYGRRLALDLLDDPFRVLEESPFSAASAAPSRVVGGAEAGVALARCDWKENPDAHVISVDVPGVRQEDMRVEVEEGSQVLRVSGKRRAEEREGERWHRAEHAARRFWRRFRMPAGADVDCVAARLEAGVLTVTVPKVAGHRGREPRVISIAGSDEGGVMTRLTITAKICSTR